MYIVASTVAIVFITYVCAQRAYYCTTPEFCDDGIQVDPRIETPTKPPASCPVGYLICLKPKCGVAAGNLQPDAKDGEATKGAFPWHAFLQNDAAKTNDANGYAGGGVLIDQEFVLTAAHKIKNITAVNVILGAHQTTKAELDKCQKFKVTAMYVHEKYDEKTLKDDIALLRLESNVNMGGNVNLVCTPPADKDFQNTKTGCLVTGYGQQEFTDYTAPTPFLKQVHLPIVDTKKDCEASYVKNLGPKASDLLDLKFELCAGGADQLDACTQDGGSPLVCPDAATKTFSVVGLVLWGKKCGQPGYYGVYANVPAYVKWITCTKDCMLGKGDCKKCPAVPHPPKK
ncbi:unnamed protein product [Callosobruchus maculatus]|uniref:Peptidase S1 domain-containing protein n=2 Tax=Callosobruchus maculatus TaxID=64391 RepID=A0A653D933_CALMS|nr:unnamed protein product [Callosobruchus maculatus]